VTRSLLGHLRRSLLLPPSAQLDKYINKELIPFRSADTGVALYAVQVGDIHPDAKALKGFGGASVLEIVSLDKNGTYRAVYTVRFEDAIHVLYAFQKKIEEGHRNSEGGNGHRAPQAGRG
jgi:phage-related protein